MARKSGTAPDAAGAAIGGRKADATPPSTPQPSTSQDLPHAAALAEHADAIRQLGKRVIADVVEIGKRLSECRNILKEDDSWRAWLKSELRLSPQTAGRFIQVQELVQRHSNLEHVDIPVSGLYLLAAPSTPTKARNEIIERAVAGEGIGVETVKETIATAKGAQPRRANSTNWTRAAPEPEPPPLDVQAMNEAYAERQARPEGAKRRERERDAQRMELDEERQQESGRRREQTDRDLRNFAQTQANREKVLDLIDAGYRALAKHVHPDATRDDGDAMQRLNNARDFLRALLKVRPRPPAPGEIERLQGEKQRLEIRVAELESEKERLAERAAPAPQKGRVATVDIMRRVGNAIAHVVETAEANPDWSLDLDGFSERLAMAAAALTELAQRRAAPADNLDIPPYLRRTAPGGES